MAEQEEETNEDEQDAEESWSIVKGTVVLLGVVVTGALIFFSVFHLSSDAKEKKVISSPAPKVKLFSEKLRITRQTGPKPVDQKRWTLEPPIIVLNKKLTKTQINKVKSRIRKDEDILRGDVDTFLRKQKVSFPRRADSKQQIAEFVSTLLEKGQGKRSILPAGWINEVVVPSFNSGI